MATFLGYLDPNFKADDKAFHDAFSPNQELTILGAGDTDLELIVSGVTGKGKAKKTVQHSMPIDWLFMTDEEMAEFIVEAEDPNQARELEQEADEALSDELNGSFDEVQTVAPQGVDFDDITTAELTASELTDDELDPDEEEDAWGEDDPDREYDEDEEVEATPQAVATPDSQVETSVLGDVFGEDEEFGVDMGSPLAITPSFDDDDDVTSSLALPVRPKASQMVKSLMASLEGFTEGELEYDSRVTDIIQRNDSGFLNGIIDLRVGRDINAWVMGGVMVYLVKSQRYKQMYPDMTARQFIEDVVKYNYRSAQYQAASYITFSKLGISADTYALIGWSKAKELLPYIDETNKDELVAKAQELSFVNLVQYLKETYNTDEEGREVVTTTGNTVKFTATVFDDQYEMLREALDLAKTLHGIQPSNSAKFDDGKALLALVLDWTAQVTSNTPQTEQELIDRILIRHPNKKIVFVDADDAEETNTEAVLATVGE